MERDPEFYGGAFAEEADVEPVTRFWDDASQTIMSSNKSPDVPFDFSLNAYRGCEHGCSYCYARPTHEYLGFSPGLDFERNIVVKRDAPELLRKTLMKPSWKPRVVAISGVTDAYQPVERRLLITRKCLKVLAEFRNPTQIITKNALVVRDIDILRQLAEHNCVRVHLSICSLRPELARVMEPRASAPQSKLKALRKLTDAGIPVTAMLAPMIPGLNDHELPQLIQAVGEAGALTAGFIPLRLPGAVAEVFTAWLEEHFPDRAEKVLNKIRSMRGGKLNDSRFHSRFQGEGEQAHLMQHLFMAGMRRAGLQTKLGPLNYEAFRRPEMPAKPAPSLQLELF